MRDDTLIYCEECESMYIICGEPQLNIDGHITETCVCLDCGHNWEEPVLENEEKE